jgi:Ca2+/Na+ antiporter
MVDSAVYIAESFMIPKVIIWLTILAIWTSVPDLLSSVIVSKKWKVDMAISNGLGSNVFDILIGLWLVYFVYFLIHGTWGFIVADRANLIGSTILLFGTIIVMISIFIFRKRKTSKRIWWFLIILYLMYFWYTIYLAI